MKVYYFIIQKEYSNNILFLNFHFDFKVSILKIWMEFKIYVFI